MITSIGTIAVMVKDAKEAAKWYREKLGFEIESDGDHWVTARVKGGETALHICQEGEWGTLEPGNQGVLFWCDNLRKTHEELKKKGVEFKMAPTKRPWGTTEAIFVDPDANEFLLMEK